MYPGTGSRDPVRPAGISLAFVVLLLTPVVLLHSPAVQANTVDNIVASPYEMQAGSLLLQMESGYTVATRVNIDVDIRVSGPVARTTVSQTFRNDGAGWVEAIYVFPLPDAATVDRLRMRIGDRFVEGEIREKEQAKAEYERARQEGKRASLVEQHRQNLFATSLANLGPGESVDIEIEYLETISYDDGQFSLRFPLTLTPRFIPGTPRPDRQGSGWAADTNRVPDASLITPPVVTTSADHKVTMHAAIDAGVPLEIIASRYHPITVTATDTAAGRYDVTLSETSVPMDHDLELVWRPAPSAMPRATLFTETGEGDSHYLLMVLPPDDMELDQAAANDAMRRELVFVIDTSGSMHGTSIEQAKQALLLALDGLTAADLFNVIQFNSVVETLFPQSVAATGPNIRVAREYILNLEANGGTEMRPALQRALRGGASDTRLRQIIFITDGSVGNEEELFALVDAALGDTRLFTVGIGSAPNSLFMRKAAETGRGAYTFISALHEVKEKMSRLIRKIEQPRVTDIEVAWPGEALAYPAIVPDLYAGEPILQTVRLAGMPRSGDLVRITGTSAMGEWGVDLPIAAEQANEGVAAVWARARIEHLLDRERQGDDAEQVRAAIIDTALGYRLVSRETSLVAVDKTPVRPESTALDSEQVPNLLPYGQDLQAIFGFPATATGWSTQLASGLILLLVAAVLLVGRHVRRTPCVRTTS
jgi:Ca-activated chloride channel family protein